MYKPHGITCKIMYFHDVISQSIRQGVTKKSVVSTLSSFRKEESVDTTDFLVSLHLRSEMLIYETLSVLIYFTIYILCPIR